MVAPTSDQLHEKWLRWEKKKKATKHAQEMKLVMKPVEVDDQSYVVNKLSAYL